MGEQKLQAALAGSKKSKKKKWAKGRVKEKKNNNSVLMADDYSTAIKDIPKMKCITVSTVSEKLRVTGSLAHRLIRKLYKEGTLKRICDSGGFLLYTKSAKQIKLEEERKAAEEAAAAKAAAKKAKGAKKGQKGAKGAKGK